MDKKSSRVCIIGGGVSGLFAAAELSRSGFCNITILEAADRPGGRVNTYKLEDGVVELGAQWIHGRGENMLWKYIQENNIPVSEDNGGDGDGEFFYPGGRSPDKETLEKTITFLENVHEELNDEKNSNSVGEHFQKRFSEFVETEKDENVLKEMESIYRWFIQWEKVDTGVPDLFQQSVSSWGEYIDYERGDVDSDPVLENGYCTLINHLLKQLTAVNIRYKTRVSEIDWSRSSPQIKLEGTTETLEFDNVIVSVSLGVLKSETNLFHPPLSLQRRECIELMGFGTMNKIFLGFEKPFWNTEHGGIQFLWDTNSLENDPKASHWTRVCNQHNVLGGWICGEQGAKLEKLSDTTILDECWNLLKEQTGKNIEKPNFIKVTRWGSDPNFRGSYSYRTPKCDEKKVGPWSLAEPLVVNGICTVQFCGESTSTIGYGTVHGAMESGLREARRLIYS
ncbi:spermine oxidase isoform X2 [Eurytemora carolleeae]|uniref:spermine oxidase isoform X2 n=1 Tax=Eurytemora carolleeae TaxID=1294199 RepID=UPI000C77AE89|nr:spermine oxidase isoform X2 [Eurytemora carolleeae]|eukprot:XP_023340276.1 spermine oxidase-like isoform X2 [Eurytemora affinis]